MYEPGVLVFDVLDRTASLNGANSETRCVREAAYHTCLPLQRTRNRLVYRGRVCQVHHVDMSLGRRDDEQLVLHIHAVHALLRVQRAHGLGALQIPELDALVPGAGRDVVFAARLEPAHALDGFLVGFCLLRRDLAGRGGSAEVDNVEVTGGVAGGEARAVLEEVSLSVSCVHVGACAEGCIPLTIRGPERVPGTQTATFPARPAG